MKIAFFAATIMEHGGGLEKYFVETARNLSHLSGFHVDIITLDNSYSERILKILRFYYFDKIDKKQLYKDSLISIKKRLGDSQYHKCSNFIDLGKKLNEYDLIYSKNELLESFILKFFLRYRNLPPIIFGCHTPIYYPEINSLQSKLHNFLYNGFVYKWLTDGVKAFHVTNNADKKLFKKIFPKQKIFKIYNPFNSAYFRQNIKQHTYNFKWDDSKYNILWIARLTEQKGVLSLINIIDEINKTYMQKKVIFNIVGNGQLENEVRNLRKKWDNINWFGYVEYCYLPSIYNNNNLFISTSRWESFGLNVLEAQASGLPAIAFNIPGPQDIITNAKSGFLVNTETEFCNKIKAIVNKEIRFDNKEIARDARETFSPGNIYLELTRMFLQI